MSWVRVRQRWININVAWLLSREGLLSSAKGLLVLEPKDLTVTGSRLKKTSSILNLSDYSVCFKDLPILCL